MAVLIGTAAGGQPAPSTVATAAAEPAAQACSGRKFETVIRFIAADGKGRQSRVKLCGTPGQTDAEWAKTLRDGAQKARGNAAWPPATRQQVVAAIGAELAKLKTAAAKSSVLMAGPPLPAPRAVLPARGAAPEYSTLPPFPPPPVARAPAAALSAAGGGAIAAAVAPLVTLARPKLDISCFNPGDIGASGPCFAFERDTMVTVRAGEPLQHVALRFARGSNVQADHPLPALARGRSTRFALPRSVCAGVAGGTLTIRIVRAPVGQPAAQQVVGTEGPYNLRC